MEEVVWEESRLPADGSDVESLAVARAEVARYRELVSHWGRVALTHPGGIIAVRARKTRSCALLGSPAPNLSKIELADDGRPAPTALPGDCCGLPSPTRVAGRAQNGRNLTI